MRPLPLQCLLVLCLGHRANCQQPGKPWTDIVASDTYNKQSPCVQGCLLNVASNVGNCVDYGCVCVGDARGANFLDACNKASDCALKQCGDAANATIAANSVRDICLIARGIINTTSTPTASATALATVTTGNTSFIASTPVTSLPAQPAQTPFTLQLINATSYAALKPCSKLAINSCRNSLGVIDEPGCFPLQNNASWNSYFGLSYELQCSNPGCLCDGGAFDLTFGMLYKKSLFFCNYLPSVKDHQDPEYDRMAGVLADFCAANNITITTYHLTTSGSANNSALKPPRLGTGDKIAIGLGVPATLAAIVGVVFGGMSATAAWHTYQSLP